LKSLRLKTRHSNNFNGRWQNQTCC